MWIGWTDYHHHHVGSGSEEVFKIQSGTRPALGGGVSNIILK